MLRPLVVLNPYAPHLRFRVDRVRMRRDHDKYLALIDTIALLHQHQRKIQTVDIAGAPVACIEATLADIALAGELMDHLLGRSLDDVPPQTRRLLGLIGAWQRNAQGGDGDAASAAAFLFSRRELVREIGWSYGQVRIHLDRLVEHDYIVQHGGGRGGRLLYELVDDGAADADGLRCPGLIDVDALAAQLGQPVPTTKVCSPDPRSLHPLCRGVAGVGGTNFEPIESTANPSNGQSLHPNAEKGPGGDKAGPSSYTQMETVAKRSSRAG
jgi:hypothetical protein